MTLAASSNSTIPTRLGRALRYPRRDRSETKTTYAARAKSKPPAIRAARFSVSEGLEADRKRQKTTAAESSSSALSPPKARRAGLRDVQAAPSETAASTLIQMIVNTWSRITRRETSGKGGDRAMTMGSPFILRLCVDRTRRTQTATSQSSLFHEREEYRHQRSEERRVG